MKKHIIEINEKYKYKIDVSYPETNEKKINRIILNNILTIKDDFIEISKRAVQLNMYYTLYITYKTYKYKNITSYILNISEYTDGAHPNNYIKSIRFSNDIINIDTLLEKDKDILTKLSNISRKNLLSKETFKDNNSISMALDRTRPSKENFENFVFTSEGLLIFFDYYQVAPYYYGIQQVMIPYNLIFI